MIPAIDWTVRFGDIIVICGIAASMMISTFRVGKFVQVIADMDVEIKALKTSVKDISTILLQLAVQQTRMDNLSERLNKLDTRIDELRIRVIAKPDP